MANEEEPKNHVFGIKDLSHKTLLQSDALYQYILDTSVYPREHECLKELREMTEKHPRNLMATPPDEGQLLSMLIKLINAKNTLEIGVYTGYSLLSTALALPPDGKVIGYDNTLWAGSVAASPDAPFIDYIKPLRGYVMELNKYLAQDSRIEICQLPVGDGITLCCRII
ncbi:hypothetical protein PHAVU_003G242451 [Phaseolus vulgaris]|uniref:caffeoyl-CoA O-methyltransferase-like n=1 Tax=Phaseolus vulgaris TaxID=3885 RepID=UPI0035CB73FC